MSLKVFPIPFFLFVVVVVDDAIEISAFHVFHLENDTVPINILLFVVIEVFLFAEPNHPLMLVLFFHQMQL